MNLIYCKHYRKKDHYYVSNKKKFLRNWKKEFLDKESVVCDDTREDNLKEKFALERKEKAEYAKKSWPAHHAGSFVIPYSSAESKAESPRKVSG